MQKRCDCCGLMVSSQAEDCPQCQYPISQTKEEHFLDTAIHDLQRVAAYGGANISVLGLINRYQRRLDYLRQFSAGAAPAAITVPLPPAAAITSPAAKPVQEWLSPPASVAHVPPARTAGMLPSEPWPFHPSPQSPVEAPPLPKAQVATRRVFSFRSFFADQAINIVASLGAFLILAGALSFIATTPNLLLSFLIVFFVHVLFGASGFITSRIPNLRVVATIYSVIFALLIPLVGFSAYRMVAGSSLFLSVEALIAIAAVYAAVVYIVLALFQRFISFAYLGMIALLIADLAIARAFTLDYWWWPDMAMLLAFAALVSVPRPSTNPWPFVGSGAILRQPVRLLMYSILIATAAGTLLISFYSFLSDMLGVPFMSGRASILSATVLLLLWGSLFLWRTKRTRGIRELAYLFLLSVLALCYCLNFQAIGYALALTGVALLYHILNRFAGRFCEPLSSFSPNLDHAALVLIALVPFISSPMMPAQLFVSAYRILPDLVLSPFVANGQTIIEFLVPGIGLALTISILLKRTGIQRSPSNPAWCWLLLLSGFLLTWGYGLGVLAWHGAPTWPFLGLTLALVACAIFARQRLASAWANPLDALALFEMLLTLLLSLKQSREILCALLLLFAALTYIVLIFQHRQIWLFLPTAFAWLALPLLLDHPLVLLFLSLSLPLASVGIRRPKHPRFVALFANQQRLNGLEWPLLVTGLLYGIGFASHEALASKSAIEGWLHIAFPVALELAILSLAWYTSAAFARMKWWMVPAVFFALGALLLPTNAFQVMATLTFLLAIVGTVVNRIADKEWAFPLNFVALCSAVMTGYIGLTQYHWTATTWILLGIAILAYLIGVVNNEPLAMWIAPCFAIASVIVSASLLRDPYRPPIMALICAMLGVSLRFSRLLPLAVTNLANSVRANTQKAHSHLFYALPLYTTAFVAALLTGLYGTLSNINYPFYSAIPDALLVFALVTFVIVILEQRPGWLWLVAGLAIWGVSLATQLTVSYIVGAGMSLGIGGMLVGRFLKSSLDGSASPGLLRQFTWSWPWYLSALAAAIAIGTWNSPPQLAAEANFIGYSLLAFTVLAFLVMLVERMPALLIFPASLAAWAIGQWQFSLPLSTLMIAYSVLCVLIFAIQFVWRIIPPVTRWIPETTLHMALGLGGQSLVVLAIIAQNGLSADSGGLAQVGIGALLVLALLVFATGRLRLNDAIRLGSAESDEATREARVQQARVMQLWCNYGTGLLLSLTVSWTFSSLRLTRLDLLTLAPASYLSVIAPFLTRNEAFANRHKVGQILALVGGALLLLPTLWLSFSDTNLLPTLFLLGESLALLLLGITTRIRIFVLSSASLIIVGGLHMLFLPSLGIPPSLALTLLGIILLAIATGFALARHQLQSAWTHWE